MVLVGNLMRDRAPIILGPKTPVLEAARLMDREHVGSVMVIEDGSPVGIFTERDLMRRVVVPGKSPSEVLLEEVMTSDLFTAHPGMKAGDLRREMQARHIRHVPVMQDGQLLGMLSLRDVLRGDLEEKKTQVDAITAYIQGGFEGQTEPPKAGGSESESE